MSEVRKSASDITNTGATVGGGGLLLAVVGLFSEIPGVVVMGMIVAVVGLVMWGAGLARRD